MKSFESSPFTESEENMNEVNSYELDGLEEAAGEEISPFELMQENMFEKIGERIPVLEGILNEARFIMSDAQAKLHQLEQSKAENQEEREILYSNLARAARLIETVTPRLAELKNILAASAAGSTDMWGKS